ncbi:DNA glycosylase/AP lyase [Amylocarpus encephaloides]|uniref:DNA glycosylase/AP lyase n=1 Tax=Amylocarpus encephaloides TaxID=45428 RepID=A0A9P7YDN6_9HELO|nr:DNA glycosylase/AP lyase [Amylocarpus encephaloides]
MPEIAEIARAVYHLRKHIVGKTLSKVTAVDDGNIFGKVGTSGPEVQKALTGKKVMEAGRQGKYFWLIMSSPPHPVFHFGMTGWFHIRGDKAGHYRRNGSDVEEEAEWPPKYWKLILETAEGSKAEAAYTDSRRFGRIRLVDCAGKDIRNTTPLKENGPDPVLDKDILTAEWLEAKMRKKHVPIKALLLDQANISGIGNWVGDEVLYNAKLHPEQYSDTFSTEQIQQLHKSIYYVCSTAIDALADSSKFPDDWLFQHRWGKGKKDAPTTLPNGVKITHLTVGGRTSAVVPSVQKKTGAVAGDFKKSEKVSDAEGDVEEKPKKKAKTSGAGGRKSTAKKTEDVVGSKQEGDSAEEAKEQLAGKKGVNKGIKVTPKKRKAVVVTDEETGEDNETNPKLKSKSKKVKSEEVDGATTGRRKSGRNQKLET